MRAAILTLWLIGCAQPLEPDCVSRCGALLFDSDDCDGFQEIEDRAVNIFGGQTCSTLHYTMVSVRDGEGPTCTDYFGRRVSGWSDCVPKYMVIKNRNWRESAYAHELAHLLECPSVDGSHSRWEVNGTWQRIDRINSEGEL